MLHQIRKQRITLPCLLLAVLAASVAWPQETAERVIAFTCDGEGMDRAYLIKAEPDRINFTIPHAGPFRWAEQGWHLIYAFPLAQAREAKLELRCGNRFQFSVSQNLEDWTVVLREDKPVRGLSNLAWRSVDLAPHLGKDMVYLKLEHSLPEESGFGGCLFEVKLTYQQPDVAIPFATAGYAATPPAIDGQLDDAVWKEAQQVTPFWPMNSTRPAGQDTVVRTAWDDEAFYAAFECLEERPDALVSLTKERDGNVYRDAAVELFVQPAPSAPYYHLALNTLGTQYDEVGRSAPEDWNPEWQCAAQTGDTGWSAEVRIPFSALNAQTPGPGSVWRANFCRTGTSDGELSSWSPLEHGFHHPERFGEMRFTKEAPAALALNFAEAWTTNPLPILGSVAPLIQGASVHLDIFPDAGNAVRYTAPVVDGRFGFQQPIPAFGTGRMLFALEDSAGATAYRHAAAYNAPAPSPDPLQVELKQPYYSDEPEIEARVCVNAEQATKLMATLTTQGSTVAQRELQPPREETPIRFPTKDLAVGNYELTLTLTDDAGTAIASVEKAIYRLSPEVHPSKVKIREGEVLYVNGEPFLPVIFFLAPGNEKAACAANTILSGGEDPQKCGELLDAAQAHGLMAMPHLCNLLRGNNDWEGLRATVSRNKNHPALLSWYLADEPEGSGDVPEILVKARQIIREIDPNHPISCVNNTPTVFAAYEPSYDIHLADPYPIPNHPITMVAEWADISRRAAGQGKPTWMCLQTHNLAHYGVKNGRYPTPGELQCMMYLSLTHGAKGIAWWCYNHAKDSGDWATYEELYGEAKAVAPYILSGEGPGGIDIVTDAEGVHVSAHRKGDECLILVANPGEAAKAVLTVSGMSITAAKPLLGGEPVTASGNAIAVDLPPMSGEAWVIR